MITLLCLVLAQQEATRIAVVAGKVYTLAGDPLSPGVIEIEGGRIVAVREGTDVPDGAQVIDARSYVVIPGLVAAYTTMADDGRDAARSISPEVRAADGLELRDDRWTGLRRGGVTTAYVTPGERRLVAGQGAVIRLGEAPTIASASFGLKVTLGESPKFPPEIFIPPVPATAENPFRAVLPPAPTTRMAEFAELRRMLAEAHNPFPDWAADRAYVEPLVQVRRGERPLWVQANKADDMVRAVLLAEEFGARIVLVGAAEAERIAEFLAAHHVPVVWDPRVTLGEQPDPVADVWEGRPTHRGASVLEQAGVTFALAVSTGPDFEEALFRAGWLVRHGLSPDGALRALAANPAALVGMQDSVGSIEAGKDADLVFLSGEPFHPATWTEQVVARGRVVYERRRPDLLRLVRDRWREPGVRAYRFARLFPGDRLPIERALLVVRAGKVEYVGPEPESLPEGLEVTEIPGEIALPGFVDLSGIVGFTARLGDRARDAGRVAYPARTRRPWTDWLVEGDPAVDAALRAGVTSVLLTPTQSGVCTLVRLRGSGAPEVMRDVAALKFQMGAGPDAREQVKKFLERARKYHEQWEAFERGEEAETPTPSADGDSEDPISGRWEGTMEAGPMGSVPLEITMRLDGTRVTGTAEAMGQPPEEFEGTFIDGELRIEVSEQGVEVSIVMTLEEPGFLSGTVTISMQGEEFSGTIELRRTGGGGGSGGTAGASSSSGRREGEPKRDEKLDPYRELFRGTAPALVVAPDWPSLENAKAVFGDEFHLPYVLVEPHDAVFHPDGLLGSARGAIYGADFVMQRDGERYNEAAWLLRRGVPIAFQSGAANRAEWIPLVGAYGVRHGMEDWEVIEGLTSGPSRLLGADAQVGTLRFGRSADFVVFSGDPMDFTSRITAVVVGGEVVFHE